MLFLAGDADVPRKAGALWKTGRRFGGTKERWFVLRDNFLYVRYIPGHRRRMTGLH